MTIKVQHRDPNQIMKLSRLGCFHQSKLSFLRSFIREFKDWEFKNEIFDLDKDGFGTAVYTVSNKELQLKSDRPKNTADMSGMYFILHEPVFQFFQNLF